MRILTALFLMLMPLCAVAEDRAFLLALPDDMIAQGFDNHLLTRFKFKTRISVTPVGPADAANAALLPEGEGARVFQDAGGRPWRLARLDDPDGHVKAFEDWLKSGPGKSAIESFAPAGVAMFTTEAAAVAIVEEESFDGDVANGAKLALVHCGRCHVVDERNRMGGIGSTPSFAALRGREGWSDLFRAFWSHNPHPSFTTVDGVSAPDESAVVHIAPVEITLDEIEAITAFVATIEAKDLGRPVQSN